MDLIIDKHSLLVCSNEGGLNRLKTPFKAICIIAIRAIAVGDKCIVDLVISCTVYKLKYRIAEKVYPYYFFVVSIEEAPP